MRGTHKLTAAKVDKLKEPGSHCDGGGQCLHWSLRLAAFGCVVAFWAILHWLYRNTYIFHDAWKHNFPETFGVSRNSACGQFAHWLMSPDTGSPTVIYAISISLTQPIRAVLLNLWACLPPRPLDAMLQYKLQIFVIYLGFALGMFVLGRVLFRHWLSALYLAAATLFAGFCVDNVHSDQSVIIVFWVPWCAAALALADRHAGESHAAIYVNLASVFLSLQLLDQAPHLAAFAAAIAFSLYAFMRSNRLGDLLKLWPRYWPAALVLLFTAGCLYVVQGQIYDYQPSQRAAINVHPSQFGQTGFIQPSAFFGTMFPLTFTAAFEEIASGYGWKGFNYRLDIPALYIGTVPLILVISLFPRRGLRGAPLGWLVFSVLLVLASLQTSQLYYALYHLPFFDLFRSYFHYFEYGIVGLLVLSGYGFDRLATMPRGERTKVLRTTLVLSGFVFVGAAMMLGAVASYGKGAGPGFLSYLRPMAEDSAIVLAAFALLAAAARHSGLRMRHGLFVIGTMIATQSIHAAGIYRELGEPAESIFGHFRLDAAMLTPYGAAEWRDPTRLRRVPCPTNASCFLAQRDGASLKRDLDGTFLRHHQSPVFQDALAPGTTEALLGITHPLIWASAGVRDVSSHPDRNHEPGAGHRDVSSLLSHRTSGIGVEAQQESRSQPTVSFADMRRGVNELSFRYRAENSALVTLAITAAPGWSATIDDVAIPIIKGTFDFIALRLPAGDGTVRLRYENLGSLYFFGSRWCLAALGIAGIVFLCFRPRRSGT